MIKIICVGKLKEKYLIDLVNDYKTRISKYHKIEIIETNPSLVSSPTNASSSFTNLLSLA